MRNFHALFKIPNTRFLLKCCGTKLSNFVYENVLFLYNEVEINPSTVLVTSTSRNGIQSLLSISNVNFMFLCCKLKKSKKSS